MKRMLPVLLLLLCLCSCFGKQNDTNTVSQISDQLIISYDKADADKQAALLVLFEKDMQTLQDHYFKGEASFSQTKRKLERYLVVGPLRTECRKTLNTISEVYDARVSFEAACDLYDQGEFVKAAQKLLETSENDLLNRDEIASMKDLIQKKLDESVPLVIKEGELALLGNQLTYACEITNSGEVDISKLTFIAEGKDDQQNIVTLGVKTSRVMLILTQTLKSGQTLQITWPIQQWGEEISSLTLSTGAIVFADGQVWQNPLADTANPHADRIYQIKVK